MSVRRFMILLYFDRSVVQSWNFAHFDLYIGGEASKLINLGFPQCKTNSSGDFRGKRQGFDGN